MADEDKPRDTGLNWGTIAGFVIGGLIMLALGYFFNRVGPVADTQATQIAITSTLLSEQGKKLDQQTQLLTDITKRLADVPTRAELQAVQNESRERAAAVERRMDSLENLVRQIQQYQINPSAGGRH